MLKQQFTVNMLPNAKKAWKAYLSHGNTVNPVISSVAFILFTLLASSPLVMRMALSLGSVSTEGSGAVFEDLV